MSLALEFFWKEYRAQRKLLIAYFALVLPSLVLFFSFWRAESEYSKSTIAIAAFAAAGVFPATCLVPAWLTSFERTSPRDDLFVQRLPGMLVPAFWGKLAFLVVTSLGLPLLSMLVACVLIRFAGIESRSPQNSVLYGMAGWLFLDRAMLATAVLGIAPWTFAVVQWLSRGRLGATTTALLCGGACTIVGVSLRFLPGLASWVSQTSWPWILWPSGVFVTSMRLARDRRVGHGFASRPFTGIPLHRTATIMCLPLLGGICGAIVVAGTDIDVTAMPWMPYDELASSYGRFAAFAIVAVSLTPWVWAASMWTTRSRMAVPVTILIALAVGTLSVALLRLAPFRLELEWRSQSWSWLVWSSGVLVAYASLVRGRHGGGPLSSARAGLTVTAALASSLFAWIGFEVWYGNRPDFRNLRNLCVLGCTTDRHYAFATGHDINHERVTVKMDLETGACEPIASKYCRVTPGVLRPWLGRYSARSRFLGLYDETSLWVLDRVTASVTEAYDLNSAFEFPTPLREALEADCRLHSPLRVPGYRRAWISDCSLHLEDDEGVIHTSAFPANQTTAEIRGHGLISTGPQHKYVLYDLVLRKQVAIRCKSCSLMTAFASRGRWLHGHTSKTDTLWHSYDPTTGRCSEPLFDGHPLALFGDDEVLVRRNDRVGWPLLTLDVTTQCWNELAVPGVDESVNVSASVDATGVLIVTTFARESRAQFRIDPKTRQVTPQPIETRNTFYSDESRELTVSSSGDQIVEIDLATKRQRVLYPR